MHLKLIFFGFRNCSYESSHLTQSGANEEIMSSWTSGREVGVDVVPIEMAREMCFQQRVCPLSVGKNEDCLCHPILAVHYAGRFFALKT